MLQCIKKGGILGEVKQSVVIKKKKKLSKKSLTE